MERIISLALQVSDENGVHASKEISFAVDPGNPALNAQIADAVIAAIREDLAKAIEQLGSPAARIADLPRYYARQIGANPRETFSWIVSDRLERGLDVTCELMTSLRGVPGQPARLTKVDAEAVSVIANALLAKGLDPMALRGAFMAREMLRKAGLQ